jgi:hypothetical protein
MNDLKPNDTRPIRRPVAGRDTVRPGPSEHDVAWERDLLLLLSNLEAVRVRTSDNCKGGRAVAALEAMNALVGQVRDFAGRRFDAAHPALAELRGRSDAFFAATAALLARLQRSTLKTLLRLFSRGPSAGDPHAQFVGCARSLVEVTTAYFNFFRQNFHAPASAHAWDETSGVFLQDFRALVALLES